MTSLTPVTELAGVGPELARRLERLQIATVGALLGHFPRRYEDWRCPQPIKTLRAGEDALIQARVVAIDVQPSPRRKTVLVHAVLEDASGQIPALWFGQPYLAQTLRPSMTFLFRGPVRWERATGAKLLSAPAYERTAGIYPIYPETSRLSSKRLRQLIRQILMRQLNLPDPLPAAIHRPHHLADYAWAVRTIHRPATFPDLARARERLAFDELFFFMLGLRVLRQDLATHPSPSLSAADDRLRDFVAGLSFTLTNDQRRVAWEVIQDLKQTRPMHRLIQGDVGSGKTVVAAFAAYVAARAGQQTIWLAPTEILANQHFETVSQFFKSFDIPVTLRTGSNKSPASSFQLPASVVIGTHALLSETLQFPHLGLVIVDEQHRFGVAQRAFLRERSNTHGQLPHFLSMTATPIPRTLALTLYADLDLSLIQERPPGRRPVKTQVIRAAERERVYRRIEQEIAAGHQTYVVCPLITESTADPGDRLFLEADRRSAETEFARLKTAFPTARIGLLHGRLKAAEKQRVMDVFARHQLDLLVTTTVIEVGMDVANATVMAIEGADHFGLAQLHQLRGRVGRGAAQSYCFLLTDHWSDEIARRLRAMAETDDGLKLAEADLKLRGPGELVGWEQSGLPDFKLASLTDLPLVARARRAVAALTPAELTELSSLVTAEVRHLE